MKQACKYNIIRFQPYAETEEFVNIGILLYVPVDNKLLFKLLNTRQYERIGHFFKQLDRKLFKFTLQTIKTELENIQKLALNITDYDKLVSPKEDIIRYSNNRAILSSNLEKTVDELFKYYVHHAVMRKERYEAEITKQIRAILKRNNLTDKFKEALVGDSRYSVRLPFVAENGQIIKPIHFRHAKPKDVIEHGLVWITKVEQLNKYGYIRPETTLFVYEPPTTKVSLLFEAFNEIRSQIEGAGITMIDINTPFEITQFVINNNNRI